MKLILVAKSDLNDTPIHDGTIRLGETFKMHALAFQVSSVNNVEHLCQRILLLKKRPKVTVYPTNFYAIAVSDQWQNEVMKKSGQPEKSRNGILDVTIPCTHYNLVGYVQFQENNQFNVVINTDCRKEAMLKEFKELAKKITLIDEDKMKHLALGYCNKVENNLANAKQKLVSQSDMYNQTKKSAESKKAEAKPSTSRKKLNRN